ncbi:MAG: NmrA/HSCARG family protein [Spirochaetaceae bacterium]|nr:NmrA/HSCARG family protein [Spirochaetaceae bacterium]
MSKILVAGATGQQGGSIVDALLDGGHEVRGLTRNTQSDRARALEGRGVELVQGDFTDRSSLEKALTGVDGAFLMSTPFEGGVEVETRQGITFVEAAHAVGVPHLVYTSVGDADQKTGVPHFVSKYLVEKRIVELGIPHTIIAPVYFHDNMLSPFVLPGLQTGVFAAAISPETRLQGVSVRNIGEFGALVFTRREAFLGKRINIAGDSLTGLEHAEAVAGASGREIGFFQVPIDEVRGMSEDMALMYEWFDGVGYSVDIEALRRDYPEVKWERFSQWASRQDWSVLESAGKTAV